MEGAFDPGAGRAGREYDPAEALALSVTFDESKHPRAQDGKFGQGAGNAAGPDPASAATKTGVDGDSGPKNATSDSGSGGPGSKPQTYGHADHLDHGANTGSLDHASKVLGAGTDSGKLASLTGAPAGSKVRAQLEDGKTRIETVNKNIGMTSVHYLDHASNGDSVLKLEHIEIAKGGQGEGSKVFMGSVDGARAAGVNRIEMLAVRDNDPSQPMNGYNAWARMGVDGDVPFSTKEAVKGTPFAKFKKVSQFQATPEGQAAWKEHGDTYKGTFGLTKDGSSPQEKVLATYAASKGMKANTNATPTEQKGGKPAPHPAMGGLKLMERLGRLGKTFGLSREAYDPEEWLSLAREDTGWRTIHGVHVKIGKGGEIVEGPAALVGKHRSEVDKATVEKSDTSVKPDKGADRTSPQAEAPKRSGGNDIQLLKASDISPLHGIKSREKLKALRESMQNDGWMGRPLVVLEGEDEQFSLTGSHRLVAAQKEGIEVPSLVIGRDALEAANLDADYLRNTDDDDKEYRLRRAGFTQAADLLKEEIAANEAASKAGTTLPPSSPKSAAPIKGGVALSRAYDPTEWLALSKDTDGYWRDVNDNPVHFKGSPGSGTPDMGNRHAIAALKGGGKAASTSGAPKRASDAFPSDTHTPPAGLHETVSRLKGEAGTDKPAEKPKAATPQPEAPKPKAEPKASGGHSAEAVKRAQAVPIDEALDHAVAHLAFEKHSRTGVVPQKDIAEHLAKIRPGTTEAEVGQAMEKAWTAGKHDIGETDGKHSGLPAGMYVNAKVPQSAPTHPSLLSGGSNAPDAATLKKSVSDIAGDLRKKHGDRVPIHAIRAEVAKRHGDDAASHANLDKHLSGIDGAKLLSVSDTRDFSAQQLNDSVKDGAKTQAYVDFSGGSKPTAAAKATGTEWHGTAEKAVESYAAANPHLDMKFPELFAKVKAEHPDVTPEQFQKGMVALRDKGKIDLQLFTGSDHALTKEAGGHLAIHTTGAANASDNSIFYYATPKKKRTSLSREYDPALFSLCREDCDCDDYEPDYDELPDDAWDGAVESFAMSREDNGWRTLENGTHVQFKDGKVVSGPAAMMGKTHDEVGHSVPKEDVGAEQPTREKHAQDIASAIEAAFPDDLVANVWKGKQGDKKIRVYIKKDSGGKKGWEDHGHIEIGLDGAVDASKVAEFRVRSMREEFQGVIDKATKGVTAKPETPSVVGPAVPRKGYEDEFDKMERNQGRSTFGSGDKG